MQMNECEAFGQPAIHDETGGKNYVQEECGATYRTVRLIVGVALISIGLFLLGGWQGNSTSIDVALFALVPLVTGLIGFCGLYVPFGISTREQPTFRAQRIVSKIQGNDLTQRSRRSSNNQPHFSWQATLDTGAFLAYAQC
jgi:hypothetical protein